MGTAEIAPAGTRPIAVRGNPDLLRTMSFSTVAVDRAIISPRGGSCRGSGRAGRRTDGGSAQPDGAALQELRKIAGVGGRDVMLRQLVFGTPAANYCACTDAADIAVTACTTCTDPACALDLPGKRIASFQFGTAPPVFSPDNAYPARLRPSRAVPAIRASSPEGATNRDELGVYNLAAPTAVHGTEDRAGGCTA